MVVSTTKMAAHGGRPSSSTGGAAVPGTSRKKSNKQLSDDEILGLVTTVSRPATPGMNGGAEEASMDNTDGAGASVRGSVAAQGEVRRQSFRMTKRRRGTFRARRTL